MKNQQDMVKTLFIKLAHSKYIPVNNLTSEFQFFFTITFKFFFNFDIFSRRSYFKYSLKKNNCEKQEKTFLILRTVKNILYCYFHSIVISFSESAIFQ